VDAIVEEAFSSAVAGSVRVRKEGPRGSVVCYPGADCFCFAPDTARFDGDGQAGAAMYWTGERIDLLNS
jgi:hypothetical protein